MTAGPAIIATPLEAPASRTAAVPPGFDGSIIFFDGMCGLCNASVDWVLKRDRHAVFRFAPLQGETAHHVLSPADTQQLGSIVLRMNGNVYRKSSAVVRILWQLGIFEKTAGIALWLIPKPFRDFGYAFIARNRYRWFGTKETCRVPTPEERTKFLP
jgi:predicted DCC family thiol-disulfide oxidoreductase YuxK